VSGANRTMTEQAQPLDRLRAAMGSPRAADVARFSEYMRPLLAALRRYVRREMAYLIARGDLDGDFPTSEDVVDETLARAWRDLQQRPQTATAKPWLYRIANAVLDEAVKERGRKRGRFVSMERPLPKAQALGEELDEAVYDFWQPDEVMKVEDVVPDDDAQSPEEAVNRKEVRRVVAQVLSELPDAWRKAVLLTQVEELSRPVAARQLGVGEDELARWVEHADAYLRARLAELGIKPSAAAGDGTYRVMQPCGRPPPAQQLMRAFDRVCRETRN
jgi:RNA polymerase sigma factor (sigma-70 family)